MENLKLQYQNSNGNWNNCDDRDFTKWVIKESEKVDHTEEYIVRCMKCNGVDAEGKLIPRYEATRNLTREEVISFLQAGRELRNSIEGDWYYNCRCKIAYESKTTRKPVEMVKCTCGHTVASYSVMNASLGTSCPDCYDRLSC